MSNITLLQTTSLKYGETIRKYREQARYNQTELSVLIGANKNSVYNWENEKRKPDVETIWRLCSVLHIPVQEFFGIYDEPPKYTPDEETLISNFRLMSANTRRMFLKAVIAAAEEDAEIRYEELRSKYTVLHAENTSAAAGTGCLFSQVTDPHYRFLKKTPLSSRADTLVTVSGRSMEPAYHDGDIVFVVYAESGDAGDDLICSTNDGVVIKRLDDAGHLYSVNPDLPFGEKFEDDNIRVMGRVIGIADADDFASDDLIDTLSDVFSDEISEITEESR